MKKNRLKSTLTLWLSALCLTFAFQSCNKEEETVAPANVDAASNQMNCNSAPPPAPCKTVKLIANNREVGNIEVATVNGNVLVTYNITVPRTYLSEIHLDLFTSMAQMQACNKVRNGCAVPNNFAFNGYALPWVRISSYTVTFPKSYVDRLGSDCFFIATQTELTTGATGWGGLCRSAGNGGYHLDGAKRFSGTSGSVYFEFCKSECTPPAARIVDYTYAWEDLTNNGNDADYNDLVVQSNVIRSAAEMKITFLATARGSAYDHKLKLKIPMAGIDGIFGDDSGDVAYTNDGTYYYVTVFESTKVALPAAVGTSLPNTEVTNTPTGPVQSACSAFGSKTVTLTLNSTYAFTPTAARPLPFEPFITVYAVDALTGSPAYDLYIYGLSQRDTWTASDGKIYPNGILVPTDWRWPFERSPITTPYPNFSFATASGTSAAWTTTPAANYQNLTFDKNVCASVQ